MKNCLIFYIELIVWRKCVHTDYSKAQKKYSVDIATKIHQRIDEIQSATSVEMLVHYSIGRCHQLAGNRKGEYAMDLVHPYRIVFEQVDGEIEVVKIIKIEDYH